MNLFLWWLFCRCGRDGSTGRFLSGNPWRIRSEWCRVADKYVAVMPSGLSASWHRYDKRLQRESDH